MSQTRQNGFSLVELLVVVVLAGVIAGVGYGVYHRTHGTKTVSSAAVSQSPTAKNIPAAPAITNTGDLDKAQTVLDQTDPDTSNSGDTGQLDDQLSNF